MRMLPSPWQHGLFSMSALVIFLLQFLQTAPRTQAMVDVSVNFKSFKNPSNRDYFNEKCDPFPFGGDCDHTFVYCFDILLGNQAFRTSDMNSANCAYWREETSEFHDQNIISFDHDMNGVQNPVTFRIEDWEGGFLLKVKVHDVDNGRDDTVDLIYYTYTDSPAANHNAAKERMAVIKGKRPDSPTSLSVEITAYCAPNYYNKNCSKLCLEIDDDVEGHFDCNADGDRVCKPGWHSLATNCTESDNIDDCTGNKCKNGATCIDGVDQYTCSCPPAYTGTLCSKKLKDCKHENQVGCEAQVGASTSNVKSKHKNLPMIIGVVAGMLLLLLLIILISVLLSRKRRRQAKEQASSASPDTATSGQQTSVMTSEMYTNPMFPADGATGGDASDLDNRRNAEVDGLKVDLGSKMAPTYAYTQTGYPEYPPPYSEGSEYGAVAAAAAAAGSDRYLAGPKSVDLNVYDTPGPQFENPVYMVPEDGSGGELNVKQMASLYEEPIKMKK